MEDKAKELVEKFRKHAGIENAGFWRANAKQCALICVKNEYNALRELLFNLRSCRVIESEKVYLHILDELIKEEQEVKQEINNL